MIGYGINPNAVQAIVRNTLSKKEVSWTEFESLAENVAQNCSLQPELVQMALLIMRLFYLHQNREQDYSISLNEFRAQVLTHELAHLELYRTMGDKWFSEHVGSGEMFAMLVELTYGLRQYDRLRSIFEQYLGSACGAQEDRLNSGVSKLLAEHMLQHPWAGIKNLIAGPTEQDLSRIWTASSEKFSKEQIGKPFEELFDETRLTGDHNRFISGLYCQETGECEVKP